MIKHLQELIAIPSVTAEAELRSDRYPFGEETAKALDYVLKLCDSFGFRTKNCDGMVGYAEIGEGKDLIGILCHLDVVPVGNDWTYPPFGGEIHDGRIYGRGVMDDKGPAMAAIYAMKDILDSGIKLNKRIRIIFGQTEEDGDWVDMEYYKSHEEMPSLGFTPDADFPAIYGEMGIALITLTMPLAAAGFTSVSGGQAANMVPDYAEAVFNGMHLEAFGKAAHGSTPWEGENAISKLMEQAAKCGCESKLLSFYQEKIGMCMHGEKIDLALSDEVSGKLSMNVGRIWCDEESVKLAMDIRFPVTYQLKDILEPLQRNLAAYGIEIDNVTDMKPVYMEKDGPLISKLMDAYRGVTGDDAEPTVMGGGTYARAMENIVAFGPVFPGRECTEHMKDEYIYIEDLEKAKEIYRLALENLINT